MYYINLYMCFYYLINIFKYDIENIDKNNYVEELIEIMNEM